MLARRENECWRLRLGVPPEPMVVRKNTLLQLTNYSSAR